MPLAVHVAWGEQVILVQGSSTRQLLPSPVKPVLQVHTALSAWMRQVALESHAASLHLSTHSLPFPFTSAKPALHMQT